ncbi:MAG TPA: hypothetical protein VK543_05745 [Puia sp.]|nr:hypothetical protein [Puia sp.]
MTASNILYLFIIVFFALAYFSVFSGNAALIYSSAVIGVILFLIRIFKGDD